MFTTKFLNFYLGSSGLVGGFIGMVTMAHDIEKNMTDDNNVFLKKTERLPLYIKTPVDLSYFMISATTKGIIGGIVGGVIAATFPVSIPLILYKSEEKK